MFGSRHWTLLAWSLGAGVAHAGAWLPEHEKSIVSVAGSRREDLARIQTDSFYEKRLSNKVAFAVQEWSDTWNAETSGEAFLGLKVAPAAGRDYSISVQAGPMLREDPYGRCAQWGGMAGVDVGRSWKRLFLDVESQVRFIGRCSHGKLDASVGYWTGPNWLTLAQVFGDKEFQGRESVHAQASVVRFNRSGKGVQLGIRLCVSGGADIEPTLIVGYWSTTQK
jgi:hypothetical protein